MKRLSFVLLVGLWLSSLCGGFDGGQLFAQFNPSNPSEPNMNFRVSVSATPSDISWSSGSGTYREGQSVYINTSLYNGNYAFSHWARDGEYYTDQQSFRYTVEPYNTSFTAHYYFQPSDPSDPSIQLRSRLYLASQPTGVASFSQTSGTKYNVDDYIYLYAYPNQGYKFLGWYNGDELISSYNGFYYCMPYSDITLTARFKYSPDSPSEPSGTGQSDIQVHPRGDVNGDYTVDVSDVVVVLNYFMDEEADPEQQKVYDVNGDGVIDVVDAVAVINYYLEE